MKVLFNWSVIVSALTTYLYWYGYWYTEGYFRFFSQDIKAYDIPLQHIIMTGVLQSLVILFSIVTALIGVSLLLQFSKNQYIWFFKRVEIFSIYVWFNLVGLLRLTLVNLSKLELLLTLEEKVINSSLIKKLVNINSYILRYVNNVWKRIVHNLVAIKDFNNKIGIKEVVKIQEIKVERLDYDIKKENSTTFDIQYILHVLIMFIVIAFLLTSFGYANKTNIKGFKDANEAYNCSIKFKKTVVIITVRFFFLT